MNLSMLAMVNRHAEVRAAIEHQLHVIENVQHPHLTVAIDGVRLDDTVVALIRPVVAAELRARIHSLDRDLEALGVNTAS